MAFNLFTLVDGNKPAVVETLCFVFDPVSVKIFSEGCILKEHVSYSESGPTYKYSTVTSTFTLTKISEKQNPTVHLILRHLKDPIVAEFPYILNLGGISIFRSALNFLYWGIGLLVGTCANVVCMICLLIPAAFFVFRL